MYGEIHGWDTKTDLKEATRFSYDPFTKQKVFTPATLTGFANHTRGESKVRRKMAKKSRRVNR